MAITLGRAYFDFFYQIVALVIVVKILADRDLKAVIAGGRSRSRIWKQLRHNKRFIIEVPRPFGMAILFRISRTRTFHISEKGLQTLVAIVVGFDCSAVGAPASAQVWNWTTDKVARGSTSSIAVGRRPESPPHLFDEGRQDVLRPAACWGVKVVFHRW